MVRFRCRWCDSCRMDELTRADEQVLYIKRLLKFLGRQYRCGLWMVPEAPNRLALVVRLSYCLNKI